MTDQSPPKPSPRSRKEPPIPEEFFIEERQKMSGTVYVAYTSAPKTECRVFEMVPRKRYDELNAKLSDIAKENINLIRERDKLKADLAAAQLLLENKP